MGAGASVNANADGDSSTTQVGLKKLPEAVEESIYIRERFPIVIDPTEQASRFFKYQTGAFISFDDPLASTKAALNRALVSSFLNGRALTLRFQTLEGLSEEMFDPDNFPIEVVDRNKFFQPSVWQRLLKPSDPPLDEVSISPEFALIICTATDFIPDYLKSVVHVIKVVDKSQTGAEVDNNHNAGDSQMDTIASMFGANEIIRNSQALVEAAFDGDLDEIKAQIEKGYHLESFDGRKHTALSEAASQGHLHVVTFLLESGADPNSLNDTGRSPLWRASFNGHLACVQLLLEAGASPSFRDKVSMESAFDVASTEEVREALNTWDLRRTEELMEARRRLMLAQLESRIKTSAEREQHARNILRKELVEKAEAGDVEGIKELLQMIVDEAKAQQKKQGDEGAAFRPRATVEVRNDLGQSLLSIAVQRDDVPLATFLLTYWKTVDEDRWDLTEGEVSPEAKVFKANVNSRDLNGWTCTAIAVFHDSRKCLELLLEHGGDPSIRSSYNKNAWDLAKDELDAAEKVTKSHAEIRQILIDFEQSKRLPALFAKSDTVIVAGSDGGKAGDIYVGLEKDGTAMVMNIEMNKELSNSAEAAKDKKDGAKKSGSKAGNHKESNGKEKGKVSSGSKGGKK